jgi:hypothetical protein
LKSQIRTLIFEARQRAKLQAAAHRNITRSRCGGVSKDRIPRLCLFCYDIFHVTLEELARRPCNYCCGLHRNKAKKGEPLPKRVVSIDLTCELCSVSFSRPSRVAEKHAKHFCSPFCRRIHQMVHFGKVMRKWSPELLRRMLEERSNQCSFPTCSGIRVPCSEWNACAYHHFLISRSLYQAQRRRKDVLGEDAVKTLSKRVATYEPVVQFLRKRQGEL